MLACLNPKKTLDFTSKPRYYVLCVIHCIAWGKWVERGTMEHRS
jgi:hypothetical protein